MTGSLLDLGRCYHVPINSHKSSIRRMNPKLYQDHSKALDFCQIICYDQMERLIHKGGIDTCIEVEQMAFYCYLQCVEKSAKKRDLK